MLKVLIVDDSAVSRTDLKTMIGWERFGYYVSGEASNGINALKQMELEMPDIVITDIDMPLMNGIELISQLEREYPEVRIIALSAYDDFDYVRQSMKKGAMDYVLKHQLDSGVLLDLLQAAGSSIEKYRDERDRQREIHRELSNGKTIRRQEFIHKLLDGSIADRKEVLHILDSLDIKMDMESLIVTIAEIDDFAFIEENCTAKEADVLIQTFLDIATEIVGDWGNSLTAHSGKGKFVLILPIGHNNSKMYLYNRLYTLLNRIRSEVKKYLNITASFGVSQVCMKIEDIQNAYREAQAILNDKFHNGKNGIFIEHTTIKCEEGFFCLDIKDEKAIYSLVRSMDYDGLRKLIDVIFNKISGLRLSRKSTQMVCAELINIIIKISKDTGIEMNRLYHNQDSPYNMIQKYETLADLKNWILSLFKKLMALLDSLNIDGSLSEITKKAVEFIHRNYGKDFSLRDVAEFAGVSSSYISRLFKEECGMGFAEYLNHVRVENAKRHIEIGDLKLKEIITRVGFNNYNYFFKVFKELAGMTPLEFEQVCKR